MKIETKYSIGQTLYYADYNYDPVECGVCNGHSIYSHEGIEYVCPECFGTGKYSPDTIIVPTEFIVEGILIYTNEVNYISKFKTLNEKKLYLTKEECQEFIDLSNGNEI